MGYIILIIGMLTAFWSGFFIGFYKRENKMPEVTLHNFKIPEFIEKTKPAKELSREEKKANDFFN